MVITPVNKKDKNATCPCAAVGEAGEEQNTKPQVGYPRLRKGARGKAGRGVGLGGRAE